MAKIVNIVKSLVCLAAGAAVGVAGGIAVAILVGLVSQWTHPTDPSAGSAAIIVMATAPFGLFLGLIGGAYAADRWRKHSAARGCDVRPKPRGRDAGSPDTAPERGPPPD
jgi:MFS family permease